MKAKYIWRLLLVVMLLVIPSLFLWSNSKKSQNLNAFDRLVLRVTAPVQSLFSWVGHGVWGIGSHYIALTHVARDNEALRRENNELSVRLRNISALEKRNETLDKLLEFKDMATNRGLKLIAAHVVAIYAQPYAGLPRLLIDKGEPDGIKINMGVVVKEGVVGRVVDVRGPYSIVASTLEDRLEPYAYLSTLNMGGRLVSSQKAPFLYEFIPDSNLGDKIGSVPKNGLPDDAKLWGQNRVHLGDELVTGIERKTPATDTKTEALYLFPRGFLIGKVSQIAKVPGASTPRIEVEPAVDIFRVSDLFVITNDGPLIIPPFKKPQKKLSAGPGARR